MRSSFPYFSYFFQYSIKNENWIRTEWKLRELEQNKNKND